MNLADQKFPDADSDYRLGWNDAIDVVSRTCTSPAPTHVECWGKSSVAIAGEGTFVARSICPACKMVATQAFPYFSRITYSHCPWCGVPLVEEDAYV